MIDVLGNGGYGFRRWSPILARMDVRFGVVGAQKAPWLTTQPIGGRWRGRLATIHGD